ncbi:hypothetical protein J5N97_024057 [Dioscorea zingiberensis]|uniref:Core Histone H2A/H2B/H3 domain-containing protein n=1 Tax=Dioscorea zingiberensis TaxID=325984 RepID=A0A9D5H8G7_9LILI|nr:hypothetical protein J5N97_024057 [Dioscorea zingiberensis]
MAPRRKVVGTLVKKTTKKIVEETLQVAVLDSQETQEEEEAVITHNEDNTTKVNVVVLVTQKEKSKSNDISEKEKHEDKKEKKKRKKKRRRIENGGEGGYKRYVFRVLKQVHPGMGASSRAMTVLDGMMSDMFERIAEEAARLGKYSGKATLSSREIHGAVRLVLPGELGKHAVAEGTKAVSNYMSATSVS